MIGGIKISLLKKCALPSSALHVKIRTMTGTDILKLDQHQVRDLFVKLLCSAGILLHWFIPIPSNFYVAIPIAVPIPEMYSAN